MDQKTLEAVLAKPTISVKTLANVLDAAPLTIYLAVGRGEIEHSRIGRAIRIHTAPWRRKLLGTEAAA
jgi:excisionase family DNA binding protein